MKRIFDFLSSPLFLASLGFPLIFFYAGVRGMELFPSGPLDSLAFRIYSGLFILSAVIQVLDAVRIRAHARALMGIGAVLILAQAILSYGFRWSGHADIGEGEQLEQYFSIDAGPWAVPAYPPLSLKTVRPGSAVIMLGDEQLDAAPGRQFFWQDLSLRVSRFFPAPLFVITNRRGQEVEGAYIKLALDDPEREYFQFKIVPHRFYVSLPESAPGAGNGQSEDRQLAGAEGDRQGRHFDPNTPRTLRLKIVRGKLTLFEGEVKKGKPVVFDGHAIRFEQGAAWVRIEIKKEQRPFLLFAGIVALISGVLMKARGRRAV